VQSLPWWPLSTIGDVARALAWTAQQLATGNLGNRDAVAMATVLNALVAAMREGETERRIELLEAVLERAS
jgi:hypothetical protein